jgi:hypothetical protein
MSAASATKPDATARVRPAARLGAHIFAAVLLGVFADVGARAAGPWALLTALGTPWLLLAFSAARGSGLILGRATAALVGALVVVTGLASYYLWLIIGRDVAVSTVVHQYKAPMWVLAGVAVGAVFGTVAASSRSPRRRVREVAWAAVAAVPLSDALLPVRLSGRSDVTPVVATLVVVSLLVLAWSYRAAGARVARVVVATLALALVLWQAENLVLLALLDRGELN